MNDDNGPNQNRTLLPDNLQLTRPVSADECALAARSRGFQVFGVQSWNWCFFGSMADVARLQARRRPDQFQCSFVPCTLPGGVCPEAVGKVYVLIGAHAKPAQCNCVMK
jgi:hypothetical protein